MADRRNYGSGSLFTRYGSWYGQWRSGGRVVSRKLGAVREPGSREGLTRKMAEAELHRRMAEDVPAPIARAVRLTIEEVGTRFIAHLTTMGRKRSTLQDYESCLRVHLAPFFGSKTLDKIGPEDVEGFMAAKSREGKASKSILNYLGLLHSIFDYAHRKGLANSNPVKLVDKPKARGGEARIRFLEQAELEGLLAAGIDNDLGRTDRTLWLVASMTGLRQGELLALRWFDVDWLAGRIRVRENYVRGEFGTPKSRRSTRSVPMADRVARELESHFQRSAYKADDDLVFPHPHTGNPLERSRLLKRFKAARKRAGIARDVRFHDLRHTFGTRMAAAGVPMRTLQEFMGHRDFATTLIYADYAPSGQERSLVESAFGGSGSSIIPSINLSETQTNSEQAIPL